MKINNNTVTEHSNFKEQKTIQASIDNPVKMLRMFTKDLYKNPLQTAIQEYINNAKDAHLMVNKCSSLIEITAPTLANQNVIIKDFGPGLSPEDVENVFAKITASNKEHSNKFKGGFGIGSKSWFSINPSFFVISNYNGIKSYYEVTFTDNIYINLQDSEETNEPNGVEVQLPLANSNQIPKAEKAIKRAIKFWKKRPKLINMKLNPLPFLYEDENFKLIKIGCKEETAVTLSETQYSIKDFECVNSLKRMFPRCSIEFKFKVGEVNLKNSQEVGPDRENFVQEMEKFLMDKAKKYKDKMPKILKEILDKLSKEEELQLYYFQSIVQNHHYPNQSYGFKKNELNYTFAKDSDFVLTRDFKGIYRINGKDDYYIPLEQNTLILVNDMNISIGRSKSKIAKEILKQKAHQEISGIHFTESISDTIRQELLKRVKVKNLSEVKFTQPEHTLDKKTITEINLLIYSSLENREDNYKISSKRVKKKIEELDIKVPYIPSSTWNMWKHTYRYSHGRRNYNDAQSKLKSCKIPFVVVSKVSAEVLKEKGFKELTIKEIDAEYTKYLKKQKEIKEKEAKKKLEELKKQALHKNVVDQMQWLSFSGLFHNYSKISLNEFKERITLWNLSHPLLNKLIKETIPEHDTLYRLKKTFSKVVDIEKTYKQNKEYFNFFKNLRKNNPLLLEALVGKSKYNEEPEFHQNVRDLLEKIK